MVAVVEVRGARTGVIPRTTCGLGLGVAVEARGRGVAMGLVGGGERWVVSWSATAHIGLVGQVTYVGRGGGAFGSMAWRLMSAA